MAVGPPKEHTMYPSTRVRYAGIIARGRAPQLKEVLRIARKTFPQCAFVLGTLAYYRMSMGSSSKGTWALNSAFRRRFQGCKTSRPVQPDTVKVAALMLFFSGCRPKSLSDWATFLRASNL
jgi:hypothetical protein